MRRILNLFFSDNAEFTIKFIVNEINEDDKDKLK